MGELVEDPVFRQRFLFERTADVLRVELWVDPDGGVTPHVHPHMEERFEVLAGHPSFLAGRKWKPARPGDVVTVRPGVRHAYRNSGVEVAHVVCEARPPSLLQEFLEDVAALSRAGKLTRRGLPKPSGLLQGAVLAHHYRDMAVLLFPPMPPPFIQRLLFPPLARLGERRGYRAGSFAKSAIA
jgi:mannose-6-phosphate isomerase-like protein (cupin superfamily)